MAKQKKIVAKESPTANKEATRKPVKKKAPISKKEKEYVPVEAEFIEVDFSIALPKEMNGLSEFIDVSAIKKCQPLYADRKDIEDSVSVLKSEYDRLLQVEVQHRQLVREKAVIIEEWTVNEKGIRLPASKISITSIDEAMIEISNRLREWVDKSKNSPVPIDPPTSIKPEKRKSFLQKLFRL